MTFLQYQEEYGNLHARMQEIAKSGFTAETRTEFDRLDVRQAEIVADMARIKKSQNDRNDEIRKSANNPPVDETPEARKVKESEQYRDAFRSYIRTGRLTEEQRNQLEARALSTGTTAGGYLVPEGFMPELEKALLATGGVIENARILRTGSGNDIPWPTVNDTTRKATIIGQGSTVTTPDTSTPFGVVVLKAYKYATEEIPVSIELLQDSFADVDGIIRGLLADSFARGLNSDFTLGSGSGAPKGVVVCSTLGATAAAAGAVAYADLVNLEHGLGSVYRRAAKWSFADSTLKAIKKLVDGQSRPLWNFEGMRDGFPPTILSYPFFVNDDIAAISSSESPAVAEKTVLFGDFQKYIVRLVMELQILRLVETKAYLGQVSFIGYMRAEGNLIDAGTHPLVHLVHPTV